MLFPFIPQTAILPPSKVISLYLPINIPIAELSIKSTIEKSMIKLLQLLTFNSFRTRFLITSELLWSKSPNKCNIKILSIISV